MLTEKRYNVEKTILSVKTKLVEINPIVALNSTVFFIIIIYYYYHIQGLWVHFYWMNYKTTSESAQYAICYTCWSTDLISVLHNEFKHMHWVLTSLCASGDLGCSGVFLFLLKNNNISSFHKLQVFTVSFWRLSLCVYVWISYDEGMKQVLGCSRNNKSHWFKHFISSKSESIIL